MAESSTASSQPSQLHPAAMERGRTIPSSVLQRRKHLKFLRKILNVSNYIVLIYAVILQGLIFTESRDVQLPSNSKEKSASPGNVTLMLTKALAGRNVVSSRKNKQTQLDGRRQLKAIIAMTLLLSGNIHPNPGPNPGPIAATQCPEIMPTETASIPANGANSSLALGASNANDTTLPSGSNNTAGNTSTGYPHQSLPVTNQPTNNSVWAQTTSPDTDGPPEAVGEDPTIPPSQPAATDTEKHFIDQHQRLLVEKVTMVKPILDLLLEKEVITQEGYNTVTSKAIDQDRMRELYTLLNSRKAKDFFCKGLEKHEKCLLSELRDAHPVPLPLSSAAAAPEKHFIDQHRRFLVQNVTMVKPILDLLLEKEVIPEEGYDNVTYKATNQDKMRELYTLLNSRKAKDFFYKGLEEYEKYLLSDLSEQPKGVADLSVKTFRFLITDYEQMLKNKFHKTYQCVKLDHEREMMFEKVYISLYNVDINFRDIHRHHEVRRMEINKIREEQTVKLSEIFEDHSGAENRTVLTVGIAGIGKTFLIHKFVYDWANKQFHQHPHLIFPFTFRQLNQLEGESFCLADLIHTCIKETKCIKKEDLNDILNALQMAEDYNCSPFKVLFVFDGLDEKKILLDLKTCDFPDDFSDLTKQFPVKVILENLIKGELLPSALIWITTRPAAAEQIHEDYVNRLTEVRGFTNDQKEEYFRKNFSDENLANSIISIMKASKNLYTMCEIPVFCWITSIVVQNLHLDRGVTDELPNTLTEMYCHFLLAETKRKKIKYGGKDESDIEKLIEAEEKVLLTLGRLAYDQLDKGDIMFYEKDLEDSGLDVKEDLLYSGLCTAFFKEDGVFFQKTVYCFVHLSIQEFMAAVYLYHCFTQRNMEVLDTYMEDYNIDTSLSDFLKAAMEKSLQSVSGHLDLFVRFLHGLSLESNQGLLGNLLGQTENSSEEVQRAIDNLKEMNAFDVSTDRCINIIHCLVEMKDSIQQETQQYLQSENRSGKVLSVTQCSALAHTLLMSEEVLDVLDLQAYTTSTDLGRRRLIPAVRNCRKARLVGAGFEKTHYEVVASALSSNPSHLIELDLSDNDPQRLRLWFIVAGFKSKHCRLQILRLRGCILSEQSCTEIRSVLRSADSYLRELDLSFNNLLHSGLKLICDGLKSRNCRLETLGLSHCLISKEGCCSLASALSYNPRHLKHLNLSFNHPGGSGLIALSDGQKNPHWALETLNVDHGGEHWVKPQLHRRYFHHLTLDTNTANGYLSLSENNRNVTRIDEGQLYPAHPERFDCWPQVLCTEGLTGRCYWEVEWRGWVYIAVTYRRINRRGRGEDCVLGENNMSWRLDCYEQIDSYVAAHDKKVTVLPVRPFGSNRVAVYLNCPAGTLSFYRVSSDSLTHLYTFQSTFTEPLYPGFSVGSSSSVSLCHMNFSPSVTTEQTTNEYRYKFPWSGLFQCSVTGLVFVTTGEGEVLYRTVQWDEIWLQSTGGTPAGPLFNIQCPQETICQLHLPHCDVTPGADLSVAHITEEGVKLLEPQEVTQTHVVVNVSHPSLYGLMWRNHNNFKPTCGQVLLFLQPPRQTRNLSVYLLPSNVPLKEVKVQHDEYIKTSSSSWNLIPNQVYSLQCTSSEVQPKAVIYHLNYGPNYHPTFEVELALDAECVTLTLLGPEYNLVWQQDIYLQDCHLTLDSKTAHRQLFLSENNTKVSRMDEVQSYPNHPYRFDSVQQVLCTEGLTGRCYWEVEWRGKVDIAMTYIGINRRGDGDNCVLGWNDKSWSMLCKDEADTYHVGHNKNYATLAVRPSGSNRLGVCLDWPAGTLSFYRVSSDSLRHLHTFQSTFTEPLYPGFYVNNSSSSASLCQMKTRVGLLVPEMTETSDNTADETGAGPSQTNVSMSSETLQTSFSPSVHTEYTTNEYRFTFPEAGLFQCRKTGLVFKTTGEGEVVYRTVQWDERWLQSTAGAPAGPLFDIQCPQESVCLLHLPHCEVTPDDDLSVAHISDEGVNFLKPLEVTKTHVVVKVTHLSFFGLWKLRNRNGSNRGQVLLLLRQPISHILVIKVLLLPSNVDIEMVMSKSYNREDKYINTQAECVLTRNEVYSLHCPPHVVQPENTLPYHPNYGPNYTPTFNVEMDLNTEVVSLELHEGPEKNKVWRHIDLSVKGLRMNPRLSVPDKQDLLKKYREALVNKVKNVEPIVDALRSSGFNPEMADNIEAELTPQARMRRILGSVTTTAAAEALFKALHTYEELVMKELGLG